MKKLFIIICLMLFSVTVSNAGMLIDGAPAAAANECAGLLICQNLETATTGFDNGESWTVSGAACNKAYTGTVLRGTQSALAARTTGATCSFTSPSYTAQDNIWVFVRFRIIAATSNNSMLVRFATSSYIVYTSSSQLKYAHGGNTTTFPDTYSTGTNYCMWAQWSKSTSSNGIKKAYVGECATVCSGSSCTRPGSTVVNNTSGLDTAQSTSAYFYEGDTDSSFVIDQYLVSSSEITTVPK